MTDINANVLKAVDTDVLKVPSPSLTPWTKAEFYFLFALRHYNLALRYYNSAARYFMIYPRPLCEWMLEMRKKSVLSRIQEESRGMRGGLVQEVPHIGPEGLTPETFKKFHVLHTPVVIEGFMKDTAAVKTWSLPWFRDHYGDGRIRAAKTKEGMFFRGDPPVDTSFGESIDMILAGEPVYMFGCSDVLYNNPHLIEQDLDVKRLSRLCNPKYASRDSEKELDPFSLQLFVGGPKSGTSFHCASSTNMFMMVYGSKRWTLVPPAYTPYMYPNLHQDGIYCDSPIDLTKSTEELIDQGLELWQHVPRYEAHIEPGDVLFNPGWWWHWVDNTSDTSLGVAHRFPSDSLLAGNPVLQTMVITNFHSLKVFVKWMLAGQGASDADILNRLFPDEHANSH